MEKSVKEILESIKVLKIVPISYLQSNFSFGFNKAVEAFNELVNKGFISSSGKVNKEKVYKELNEEYVPSIKIIFLDVDGVLNCHSTKDCCGIYRGIEDKKVNLLKEIVDATGAKVVLVSSWKQWWFKEPYLKDKQDDLAIYLDEKLAKKGICILDKTNDGNSFNRGEGILEYLRQLIRNKVDVGNYVVLDDEIFDYKETKITSSLIQTSYNGFGLTKKHTEKAISQLLA